MASTVFYPGPGRRIPEQYVIDLKFGTDEQREGFWLNVSESSSSSCWEWTGDTSPSGYGAITRRVGGVQQRLQAHRVAKILCDGPAPEGMVTDHLCRNRGCVNPLHLEWVTHAENIRRGDAVKKLRFCRSGHHEMTGDNILHHKDGGRECLACHRARAKARYWADPASARAASLAYYYSKKLVQHG